MKPVKQEDSVGCAVACVAFICRLKYGEALKLFKNGYSNVNTKGFLCKEIVTALNRMGLRFEYKYITKKNRSKIYKSDTIVFLRRSKRYPEGHYLVRSNKKWMDSWINFPDEEIKAGCRNRLPERPIYAILQVR